MTARRKHSKPDSIWLFDYNSLLALDDCPKWFVLLSERDMNIIWQSTLNIDRFRSRVFTDVDGLYYTIADLDQFGNFKEWVSDMNVNMGDYMACNELLERMMLALEALAQKSCCPPGTQGGYTGSRGGGTQARPPIDYDENEGEEVPPPGFDDWSEYRSHKCNAAADLINNLGSDLQGLSGLTYSATSPSVLVQTLVVFFLTPIPYDDLITLAAFLIGTGYNYTFLSTMSSEISDNYENLLCILYNSATAENAKTDFLAELETIAGAAFPNPDDAQWTMDAVEYMLQYDAFNKLFEDSPTTIQDEDCSMCGATAIDIAVSCDVVMGDVISGNMSSGAHEIHSVEFPWSCNPETPLHIIGIVGSLGGSFQIDNATCGSSGMEYWGTDGDGVTIPFPQSGCPPDGSYRELYMKRGSDNTLFTFDFDLI